MNIVHDIFDIVKRFMEMSHNIMQLMQPNLNHIKLGNVFCLVSQKELHQCQ